MFYNFFIIGCCLLVAPYLQGTKLAQAKINYSLLDYLNKTPLTDAQKKDNYDRLSFCRIINPTKKQIATARDQKRSDLISKRYQIAQHIINNKQLRAKEKQTEIRNQVSYQDKLLNKKLYRGSKSENIKKLMRLDNEIINDKELFESYDQEINNTYISFNNNDKKIMNSPDVSQTVNFTPLPVNQPIDEPVQSTIIHPLRLLPPLVLPRNLNS